MEGDELQLIAYMSSSMLVGESPHSGPRSRGPVV